MIEDASFGRGVAFLLHDLVVHLDDFPQAAAAARGIAQIGHEGGEKLLHAVVPIIGIGRKVP